MRGAAIVAAAAVLGLLLAGAAPAQSPRPGGRADSLERWRSRTAADDPLRPYALREAARLEQALGDTARAESTWTALASVASPYRWEADEWLVRRALARGDTAAAGSRLGVACYHATGAGRLRCQALRLAIAEARGDRASADLEVDFLLAAASPDASVLAAIASVDRATARGMPAVPARERRIARVEERLGRRAAAQQRLQRSFASATPPDRAAAALELAESFGAAGRLADARAWQVRAALAADSAGGEWPARAALVRERVRQVAALGAVTARRWAIGFEPRAGDVPFPIAQRLRERARELEAQQSWAAARATLDSLATHTADPEAHEAQLRSALMSLALGEPDSAMARLWHPRGEAGEFWRAVLLRRSHPWLGEPLLAEIARRPGFTHYRVAARETLGVAAPAPVAVPAVAPRVTLPPALRLAQALADQGLDAEAFAVTNRWWRGESGDPPPGGDAEALLAASALSARLGRRPFSIALAGRARAVADERDVALLDRTLAAMYPLDALQATARGDGPIHGVDRALVTAVVWQESKFDARAVSRTGVTGLMQLTQPTAREVARQLRLRRPRASQLLDGAYSLRLGTRYLENLLRRFPGDTVLAVASYNAGPGAVSRFPRVGDRAGKALEAELVAYPEAQDYVKRVLTARAAYRARLAR